MSESKTCPNCGHWYGWIGQPPCCIRVGRITEEVCGYWFERGKQKQTEKKTEKDLQRSEK
jgi:hypothetical protein